MCYKNDLKEKRRLKNLIITFIIIKFYKKNKVNISGDLISVDIK